MDELILAHVGARIRQYRKSRGLTAAQLAALVHKSKASISKYESGRVAIDIATLWGVAQALGVSTAQLFDFSPPGTAPEAGAAKSPFGSAEVLYVYHRTGDTVHPSVLHLSPDEGGMRATLFYKLENPGVSEQCACIYHGRMYYHDVVVSFVLQNYHNPVENALMNFNIPLRKNDLLVGMLSGLDDVSMTPTSLKVALSQQPLAQDDALRALLALSPEAFKEMRRKNMLFVVKE